MTGQSKPGIFSQIRKFSRELTSFLEPADARFAADVTGLMWRARGGPGLPPQSLVDAVAVHLSGFSHFSSVTRNPCEPKLPISRRLAWISQEMS